MRKCILKINSKRYASETGKFRVRENMLHLLLVHKFIDQIILVRNWDCISDPPFLKQTGSSSNSTVHILVQIIFRILLRPQILAVYMYKTS